MNLLSLLLKAFTSDSSVSALTQNTGTSSKGTSKLLLLAIPLLLKYLTQNASKPDGALSLMNALGQHTSTEPISQQLAGADQADGMAILGHILGNDQQTVVQNLAQQTNMNTTDVSNVLGNISPALLSGLSQVTSGASAQQSGGAADAAGLLNTFGLGGNAQQTNAADLFGGLMGTTPVQSIQQKPQGGLLSTLLGGLFGNKPAAQEPEPVNDTALNGVDLLSSLLSLG